MAGFVLKPLDGALPLLPVLAHVPDLGVDRDPIGTGVGGNMATRTPAIATGF